MKNVFIILFIFFSVLLIYFAVGTNFSFKPKWTIDYYNPMTNALLNRRLEIQNPSLNYDLVKFENKWYIPWGVLPSVAFLPLQLLKGRYIPPIYISILFASLNALFFYLILLRVKKDLLHSLNNKGIFWVLILFLFGTTHFYVGTLGSSWHVEQITTSFLETLGFYFILKKKRTLRDYFLSSLIFSLALIGRPTIALLISFPAILFIFDNYSLLKDSKTDLKLIILKFIIIFCLPFLFFMTMFFSYNYLRFRNPLEYGYSYINESPYLAEIRKTNGSSSIKNIPNNFRYMILEIPSMNLENNRPRFNFNLNGNSIFFLSPSLLAIFWALPFSVKKRKFKINIINFALWLSILITITPNLMHYSSGWMQFGYRYSLDIIVPLVILSLFGIKGKMNFLYILGIIFSIGIYYWGIRSLY